MSTTAREATARAPGELIEQRSNPEPVIAVAVRNRDGSGGINKGVTLEIQDKPEAVHWKRSTFNGLAQVIVQAGKEAGTLHLTAQAEGLTGGAIDITSASDSCPAVQP